MVQIFSCPRCGIGRFRPGRATYVQLHHDKLLTVPDASAHICDVCGYQEFAGDMIQHIRTLLREKEHDRTGQSHAKSQGS